jgi:hemolysin activation/secretion protein
MTRAYPRSGRLLVALLLAAGSVAPVALAQLVPPAPKRAEPEKPRTPEGDRPIDQTAPPPVPKLTPIPATLAIPLDEDNLPQASTAQEGGPPYKVSRFVLQYRSTQPALPPLRELELLPVELGLTAQGYVAPRDGVPSVVIRIGDTFGSIQTGGANFFPSAILKVSQAIVGELQRRQIIGLFVLPSPDDIDDLTGDDLRERRGKTDLGMTIWAGLVRDVRTVAAGERVPESEQRINNPVHKRLIDQSPLKPGDLLRKDKLDNFALRKNRHPGRRVDAALGPTDKPGEVVLDYLVSESRPWTLYAQLSNTGTKQTNNWRQRVGYTHNQLSNHDDVFRLDYVTSSFKDVNAVNASYDRPLGDSGVTLRGYAGWNQYTASDVGLAGETFEGAGSTFGGEMSVLMLQRREWFLDAIVGGRFEDIRIFNSAVDQRASSSIFTGYTGFRLSRETDAATTRVGLTLDTMMPFVTGVQAADLNELGRLNPDGAWSALKWEAEHAFYLEPLINGHANAIAPSGAENKGMTLAHELVFSTRGQYAFDKRLIANAQQVAGGIYSVRGYPESVSAGDTVFLATAEYRFHLPRTFAVQPDPTKTKLFGRPFRYAPQQPYGRADWDLIFRAFVDVGRTVNSRIESFENNATLIGAGVGLEFQFQQNLSARIDYGFALRGVDATVPVSRGDGRLHFVLTVLY